MTESGHSGSPAALSPGKQIGILGGGQLARMLAMAALRLGFRVSILDPQHDSPAAELAAEHFIAAYDDMEALEVFARTCSVITYEFENVPAQTAEALANWNVVHPSPKALATSQDRLTEKDFLRGLGIETAPYRAVANETQLREAMNNIGSAGILKTRRLGYDGKGQVIIGPGSDLAPALELIAGQPCIYERLIAFDREISVIAARSANGDFRAYDPAENRHRDGILRESAVPAAITAEITAKAFAATRAIMDALDYVGVIGVEFFVAGDRLLVNEFAPRVHNSGHWTEAACLASQFEQHIRAVAGLPLAATARHSDCLMRNLIGDEINGVARLIEEGDCMLHLYGKAETRPGRKMGHVTWLRHKA